MYKVDANDMGFSGPWLPTAPQSFLHQAPVPDRVSKGWPLGVALYDAGIGVTRCVPHGIG